MPAGLPLFIFKLPCLKFFDHDKIKVSRYAGVSVRGHSCLVRPGTLKGRILMAALKAGEMAPDFELPAVTGKQRHKFKLSDFRGKKIVILAFYPLDWSPT
jgi:hypothetical protein